MHVDSAIENYKRMTQPKYSLPATDNSVLLAHIVEPEFLAMAEALEDEAARSIAVALRGLSGKRRAKVDPAQKRVLAAALLSKFGTAAAVYSAAFGMTEAEFRARVSAN